MCPERPMISVIVPVYKVEKYLRRCVDSILAQTYTNYELILVDDGSPDQSGKICDEYAELYSFVRVIHQKNQGLSGARNSAVPVAKGSYVSFIDADDFVTEDYLEYLLQLCLRCGTDISVGGYVYQYDQHEIKMPKEESFSGFLSTEDALSQMNYGKGFSVFAWGKLYKKDLVQRYPYPAGKLYEDLATTYKIIGDTSGVAFGNKQIYYWVQRGGSIMHSGFNRKQLDGIEAAEAQLEYLQAHYPGAEQAARYRCAAKAVELIEVYFKTGKDKDIFCFLRDKMKIYSKGVLRDKKVKGSMKIRIIAALLGYNPARIVFAWHEYLKKRRFA